jgi:hypothetical protein
MCPDGRIIRTQSFVLKITGASQASQPWRRMKRECSYLEICSPIVVKQSIAGRVRPTDLRLYVGSTETGNRAKPHGRSRQLETGDDDREDHVQIWSCRQIPHFERRSVNAAVPFKQLEGCLSEADPCVSTMLGRDDAPTNSGTKAQSTM